MEAKKSLATLMKLQMQGGAEAELSCFPRNK